MEKEVSFFDLLNIAKQKYKLIILVYFFLTVLVGVYLFITINNAGSLLVQYEFEWDGINEGKYLNGNKFLEENDMYIDEVVETVIKSNDNFYHMKKENIQDKHNFKISPIITKEVLEVYVKNEVKYSANIYDFQINYKKLGLDKNSALNFLNTYVEAYLDYVKENHTIKENIIEEEFNENLVDEDYESTNIDYYDIYLMIVKVHQLLLLKLDSIIEKDLLDKDLLAQKNKLQVFENEVFNLYEQLRQGGYAKIGSVYRGDNRDIYLQRNQVLNDQISKYIDIINAYNYTEIPIEISKQVVEIRKELDKVEEIVDVFYLNVSSDQNATSQFKDLMKKTINKCILLNNELNTSIKKFNTNKIYLSENFRNYEGDISKKVIFAGAIIICIGSIVSLGIVLLTYQSNENKD